MMRLFLMVAALMLSTVHFSAASSASPDEWTLVAPERQCAAQRTVGGTLVLIRRSALANTTSFIVEGPGRVRQPKHYQSTFNLSGSGIVLATSSLLYPIGAKRRSGLLTTFGPADVARIEQASHIRVKAGEKLAKQVDGLPNAPAAMTADLPLGSTAALNRRLDQCVADLHRKWGMVDGHLAHPATPATPAVDLYTLFDADDFPAGALAQRKGGTAQATLLVDDQGSVIDCVTADSTKVEAIEIVICQLLEQRARYVPARDAAGKAVISLVTVPPIQFDLGE